ncbi:MAG: hypothetical protein A3J28_00765 [Acidobacteria bacterium RIFCSPLOWO2_12_FULL_60_22]|nr:MAG: hypothetical protein A3J28_00765 [Acidobacteria bacterium RIFCSPLOWO2_12_FULL_60_22]
MDSVVQNERRRYRRYIVRGEVKLRSGSVETSGGLVNLGQGGMLIRSGVALAEGREMTIHAKVAGYPNPLEVPGRVIRVQDELTAIQFLKPLDNGHELLLWLARENYPWTGTDASDGPDPAQFGQVPSKTSSEGISDGEMKDLLDSLDQLG